LKCPYCSFPESKVVDSRPAEDGNCIRRRRECQGCHQRFTTFETFENIPLVVVKRDGTRQTFDRGKLLGSMIKAFERRTVSLETLEEIVDEIEQSLQNNMQRQIPSAKLGEMVLEKLWHIDEVAYVRFASVYRQFKDINTFVAEINRLQAEKGSGE